jgi:predicted nucleotidyltransferase
VTSTHPGWQALIVPTSRRDEVRASLLQLARVDDRVAGAAITGSAAAGREDRWSDVDLFFGVTDVAEVLADFSRYLYDELGALHHFDLAAGPAAYRGFLLPGLLEVDLGFTPVSEFRSYGTAPFVVAFGEPVPPRPASGTDVDQLTGLIWHHVLHARSSIERGRPWLAEYWISQARFHVLTLAADRHGLDTAYARGADSLPDPVKASLDAALVRALDPPGLSRALQAVTRAALTELRQHDEVTAKRLRQPLLALADHPEAPQ